MNPANLKSAARIGFVSTLNVLALLVAFASGSALAKKPARQLDKKLEKTLKRAKVEPIDVGVEPSADLFVLGQALFFDRILSGNKDTSCATCHHPFLATGDGLSLPVGTGPVMPGAIGVDRIIGQGRHFVPRNAPEIFDRGAPQWTSQFWDSRVSKIGDGTFLSPAGDALPQGLLSSVLGVQAMFPVTSRDEMRGSLDDVAGGNEIAAFEDTDLAGIWEALMQRLRAIDEYQVMFLDAYGVPADALGFDAVANAIAGFEAAAFGYEDSPFDEYLRGDVDAISDAQKRGALLFYGKANCSSCHAGTLMTDQKHYNLGVPQLGPGKDAESGLDLGRFAETGNSKDLFRFRTPPLRNVAATGPWMHNGAYADLREAVRHHLNPRRALSDYDPLEQLDQIELAGTVTVWPAFDMGRLDITPRRLSDDEFEDLMAFLDALTAPLLDERLFSTIPNSVPSGLPVEPFSP